MQVSDLSREVREQRTLVAKLRMTVRLGKEKDSAKYKREKYQLARMLTVVSAKKSSSSTPDSSSEKSSKPVSTRKK